MPELVFRNRWIYLLAGSLALAGAGSLAWLTRWHFYIVWMLSLSLFTFVVYALDKAWAGGSGRRVPESFLHWLAVAGGFPGAWAGRAVFRHKRRKPLFFWILLGSTILHGSLLFWLFLGRM